MHRAAAGKSVGLPEAFVRRTLAAYGSKEGRRLLEAIGSGDTTTTVRINLDRILSATRRGRRRQGGEQSSLPRLTSSSSWPRDWLGRRVQVLSQLAKQSKQVVEPTGQQVPVQEHDVVLLAPQPVPWNPDAGYSLAWRPPFHSDPLYHAAGCYYSQDAASQLLASLLVEDLSLSASASPVPYPSHPLPPPRPLRVLDLCAAPGGKSGLLAQGLAPGSLLISNDVDRRRAMVLAENLRKSAGPAANVIVTSAEVEHLTRVGAVTGPSARDLIQQHLLTTAAATDTVMEADAATTIVDKMTGNRTRQRQQQPNFSSIHQHDRDWSSSRHPKRKGEGQSKGPLTSFFDLVLVDAPCSGSAMFRKEPSALSAWSLSMVQRRAELQREILKRALRFVYGWTDDGVPPSQVPPVAPSTHGGRGGRLLYMTCSFDPAENHANVAWLHNHVSNIKLATAPHPRSVPPSSCSETREENSDARGDDGADEQQLGSGRVYLPSPPATFSSSPSSSSPPSSSPSSSSAPDARTSAPPPASWSALRASALSCITPSSSSTPNSSSSSSSSDLFSSPVMAPLNFAALHTYGSTWGLADSVLAEKVKRTKGPTKGQINGQTKGHGMLKPYPLLEHVTWLGLPSWTAVEGCFAAGFAVAGWSIDHHLATMVAAQQSGSRHDQQLQQQRHESVRKATTFSQSPTHRSKTTTPSDDKASAGNGFSIDFSRRYGRYLVAPPSLVQRFVGARWLSPTVLAGYVGSCDDAATTTATTTTTTAMTSSSSSSSPGFERHEITILLKPKYPGSVSAAPAPGHTEVEATVLAFATRHLAVLDWLDGSYRPHADTVAEATTAAAAATVGAAAVAGAVSKTGGANESRAVCSPRPVPPAAQRSTSTVSSVRVLHAGIPLGSLRVTNADPRLVKVWNEFASTGKLPSPSPASSAIRDYDEDSRGRSRRQGHHGQDKSASSSKNRPSHSSSVPSSSPVSDVSSAVVASADCAVLFLPAHDLALHAPYYVHPARYETGVSLSEADARRFMAADGTVPPGLDKEDDNDAPADAADADAADAAADAVDAVVSYALGPITSLSSRSGTARVLLPSPGCHVALSEHAREAQGHEVEGELGVGASEPRLAFLDDIPIGWVQRIAGVWHSLFPAQWRIQKFQMDKGGIQTFQMDKGSPSRNPSHALHGSSGMMRNGGDVDDFDVDVDVDVDYGEDVRR